MGSVFPDKGSFGFAVVGSQKAAVAVFGSPWQDLSDRTLIVAKKSFLHRSSFLVGVEHDSFFHVFCVHGMWQHCFYCSSMQE